MEQTWLDSLSTIECVDRLRDGRLGRVGISIDALPVILPVFYVADDDGVWFFTQSGTKLAAATINAVVAFEVDDVDADGGWSVMVLGRCKEVNDGAVLERWNRHDRLATSPGRRDHLVCVPIQHISGRSFSWASMPSAPAGYL